MPVPERRTRGDLIAAAILAVTVLAVATVLWWTSDAHNTTLMTATGPAPGAQSSVTERLPRSLTEAWRAPSSAAPLPLVQDGTVVTGAGGMVAGRDLRSGQVRWSYRRDRPLCAVAAAFHHVLAVYQRGQSCAEVTELNWADGRRGAQRTGPVESPTRLIAAGTQAAAGGRRYLEVWRSDLVRTLAYGRLPTPVQPATQPRPDCLHESMALSRRSGSRLAVIEQCPGERARITVQKSDPKEPEQPEVIFSTLLPGQRARVVALDGDRVAVALPDPARLVVLDGQGKEVANHPLAVPESDLTGNPPGGVVDVTETATAVYWFTGSVTVALDIGDLAPRWTHPGSLGPGSELAGRLLLPVPGALAVLDTTTGAPVGMVPVDRGGYRGPVNTASAGGVVLEQRGDSLVALR